MRRLILSLACALFVALPLTASAQSFLFFSFGGRVISLPVPCLEIPGSYGFVILPAGRFGPTYVYTPFLSFGLGPTFVGQQVLGVARTLPVTCNGVPSFHVHMIGSSIRPF